MRPCLNCGDKRRRRRRHGLCYICYNIPKVRKKFPRLSTSRKGGRPPLSQLEMEIDFYGKAKGIPLPTKELPGSAAKILVLQVRIMDRLETFIKDDARRDLK